MYLNLVNYTHEEVEILEDIVNTGYQIVMPCIKEDYQNKEECKCCKLVNLCADIKRLLNHMHLITIRQKQLENIYIIADCEIEQPIKFSSDSKEVVIKLLTK